MKTKKLKIICLFFVLSLIVSIGSIKVFADKKNNVYNTTPSYGFQETKEDQDKKVEKSKEDKKKQDKDLKDELAKYVSEKQTVTQGGQPLKSKEYPLDNYTGVSTVGAVDGSGGLLSLSNGMFVISKWIFEGTDFAINSLANKQILTEQAPKVEGVASSIWDSLTSVYAITLIAIAFIYAFFHIALKSDSMTAFFTMFKVVLVFVIAGVWFMKADSVIQLFEGCSNQIQSSIISASAPLRSTPKEIPQGQEIEATTAVLRNTAFNTMVYRPYLMMNWGSVDEAKIEKNSGKGAIDEITALVKNHDNKGKVDDYLDKHVNYNEHNTYMDHDGSGVNNKVGIAFLSVLFSILIGIPLIIISLANLIVQFLILGVVLLLPLAFLISLVPRFSNGGYKLLEKMAFLFLSKALISLFVLMMLLAVSIVDGTVPITTTGGYMMNTVLLIVILNVILAKRKEVVSLVTAGSVNMNGDSGGVRRAGAGAMLLTGAMMKAGRGAKRGMKSVARRVNPNVANQFSKSRQMPQANPATAGGVTRPFAKSRQMPDVAGMAQSVNHPQTASQNRSQGQENRPSDKREMPQARPQKSPSSNGTQTHTRSSKRDLPQARPQQKPQTTNTTKNQRSDKRNLPPVKPPTTPKNPRPNNRERL